MIKWYDYLAAILVADMTVFFALSIPGIGLVMAYIMVFHLWDTYCEYRSFM